MDSKIGGGQSPALSPDELLEFENLLDLVKSLVKRDSHLASTRIKRVVSSLRNSGIDNDGALRVTAIPGDNTKGSPTATDCTNNQRRMRYSNFNLQKSQRETDVNMHVELGEAAFLLEGQRFFVHVYKINEFATIKDLLDGMRVGNGPNEIELDCGATNFANMLQVLYSSAYNTNSFDVDVLESTLLVATKYKNTILREFALNALATQHTLSPMKRIEISRACELPDWLPEAIDELCRREEPITLAEADKLGLETFVAISTRRAEQKYNQGKCEALNSQSQSESKSQPEINPRPEHVEYEGCRGCQTGCEGCGGYTGYEECQECGEYGCDGCDGYGGYVGYMGYDGYESEKCVGCEFGCNECGHNAWAVYGGHGYY